MAESPHHSVTSAAFTQHEDPVADAAQKSSTHLTLAAQTAQTVLNLRAALLNRRADRADRSSGADAQLDPLAAARRGYAPMLARDRGRDASLQVALDAWRASAPFAAEHRDAQQAHERAEARLRVLAPDAMQRFAALRQGLGPQEAMREVVPLLAATAAAEQARGSYAVVLGEQGAAAVDAADAARAWEAAAPLRVHLADAEVAATRAEVRLRELHPQVMARFDELRVNDPQQAMALTVADLLELSSQQGAPQAHPEREQADQQTGHQTDSASEPERAEQQHEQVVRAVLEPELAAAVLDDTSWPKLVDALDRYEAEGLDGAAALELAVQARDMSEAAHPAGVLAHRMRELSAKAPAQPRGQTEEQPGEQTGEQISTSVVTKEESVHAEAAEKREVPPVPAAPLQQQAHGPDRQTGHQPDTQPDRPEEPRQGSEVGQLAQMMYPIPLGSSDLTRRVAPEQVPAQAALLREQGEREVVTAQVQASTPDDVTTAINEHREGLAASLDTHGQAEADLQRASALQAQGTPPSWSPQEAANRAGVAAAMQTFPTRLTADTLAAAHQGQQAQQGTAPAAVKAPAPATTATPATPTTAPRRP